MERSGRFGLLAGAMLLTTLAGSAQTLENVPDATLISLQFGPEQVLIREIDGFHRVELAGEPDAGGSPGSPWMPAKYINVLLPAGAHPVSVEVEIGEVVLKEELQLYPYQPPRPLSDKSPVVFLPPDPAVYATDTLFPAVSAELGEKHRMRGFEFVTVRLNPLRYNPFSQTLLLATSMTVRVQHKTSDMPMSSGLVSASSPLSRGLFDKAARKLVVNPEDMTPYTAALSAEGPLAPGGKVDYLIITDAALSDAFQSLANYRAQHNEFRTKVLTTDHIVSTYSGVDTQARIRACIRDYVQHNALIYAVLGGDDTVVPDRDCYVQGAPRDTESKMPTYLYYSGLDSTWDENGNGIYGEADYSGDQDEGDLAYDVIVGRIPVRTASEATAYINKVIGFESTNRPPIGFNKKLMVLGNTLWDKFTGSGRPPDLCNDGYSEFQNHDPVSDAEVWQRRIYRDTIKPYWEASNLFGVFFDTLTTWDTSTPGDYLQNSANTSERLNQGWNIINMYTHGGWDSWALESSSFDASAALALTNVIGVVYTEACITGAFDSEVGGDPCLSEGFLRNGNGGAVAYIGCSRYGWGGPGSTYGGPSCDYAMAFYRQIFEEDQITVGQAFADHKAAMVSYCGENNCLRWLQFGLNFQGDPALTLPLKIFAAAITNPATQSELKLGSNVMICAQIENDFAAVTNVEFFAQGSLLGNDSSAPYEWSWNPVAAGHYNLTVVARDNSGRSATSEVVSVTVVTNLSPAVSITSPIDGAIVVNGTSVEITAAAFDPDGVVTQVGFYGDGKLLAEDAVAPYSCTWSEPARDTHSLWAMARDQHGATQTSTVVQFTVVEEYTYAIYNKTITITGYTGSGGAVTIPGTISGLPVTSIGDRAFYGCTSLSSVTIPNSVTSIGTEAFAVCNMTSVTIPDSVTSIGVSAFYSCYSLTNAIIGKGVASIGDAPFRGCDGLLAITVNYSNSFYISVDGVLFNKSQTRLIQCPARKAGSYMIPAGVTNIGASAFLGCTSLTSVTIPDSVSRIGEEAFWNCSSLTSVMFPHSITTIGGYAFSWCTGLTEVYFKGNSPDVGSQVFDYADNATVYRTADATGWPPVPDLWAGRPTALWDPASDVDADGIPASWELQYFGGTTNANPNAICANGINTVLEAYIAGLDPNDPQSRLLISDFRSLTAGSALRWNVTSGRLYNVYWTTNLMSGFQPLQTNILWPQCSFTNSTAVPCGFYKIDVKLAP